MENLMQTHSAIRRGTPDTTPWYAHRWPWLLMLGPLIVVLAGSYTAWLAVSGQDALVVDDYYKQGKAINQDLRRDRVASGMKLGAELRYDAAAGKLSGNLSTLGHPLADAIVIRLVHSTLPAKDIQLEAQADQNGNFSVRLPLLDMARWQVMIEGANGNWRLNGVWNWPHERQVAIAAD
jgi:hypothetical protein